MWTFRLLLSFKNFSIPTDLLVVLAFFRPLKTVGKKVAKTEQKLDDWMISADLFQGKLFFAIDSAKVNVGRMKLWVLQLWVLI